MGRDFETETKDGCKEDYMELSLQETSVEVVKYKLNCQWVDGWNFETKTKNGCKRDQ